MNLDQARAYMLSLINRDRATKGVGPVQLDPVANNAAQWHSDEMAKQLFNSHWHPDGSKPPQRYTKSGGLNYDCENSHGFLPCPDFTSEVPADQSFTASEVEREESCYFDEVPPRDGHRINILDPARTHVGVGLTLLLLTSRQNQLREVTSSQEFVNRYGRYLLSANEMKPNVPFIFGGVLQPDVTVQSIQLLWEKEPEPLDLDTLRRTVGPYSYSYPNPSKMLLSVFPVPYAQKPNVSLLTKGNQFKLELLPDHNWKPGLIYIIMFVNPGRNKPVEASQIVVPYTKN